jgi:integrase
MASFRKRAGRWQARITRKSHPDLTKTFASKDDALRWARAIEREIDTGSFLPRQCPVNLTLSDIIKRYVNEVVPRLRGACTETVRLKTIDRHLGRYMLTSLTSAVVATFRDQRLKEVSASTCLRELQTLSAMLTVAQREWQLVAGNPVQGIRKPTPNRPRERRLGIGEESLLMAALTPATRLENGRWSKGIRNIWLKAFVELALETAMRRGELLTLRWENVDLEQRTAFLPMTKNGSARSVPLTPRAIDVVRHLPRSIDGRVFPLTANAIRQSWERVRLNADLPDLHLHDLRHEATSRLSERLNVLELGAVTGHRDLRMLQRYFHPNTQNLAKKLAI